MVLAALSALVRLAALAALAAVRLAAVGLAGLAALVAGAVLAAAALASFVACAVVALAGSRLGSLPRGPREIYLEFSSRGRGGFRCRIRLYLGGRGRWSELAREARQRATMFRQASSHAKRASERLM